MSSSESVRYFNLLKILKLFNLLKIFKFTILLNAHNYIKKFESFNLITVFRNKTSRISNQLIAFEYCQSFQIIFQLQTCKERN